MFKVKVFNIGAGFLLLYLMADVTVVSFPEGDKLVKADFRMLDEALKRVRERLNYRSQTWYTFDLKRREDGKGYGPGFDVVSVCTESGQSLPVWRP